MSSFTASKVQKCPRETKIQTKSSRQELRYSTTSSRIKNMNKEIAIITYSGLKACTVSISNIPARCDTLLVIQSRHRQKFSHCFSGDL